MAELYQLDFGYTVRVLEEGKYQGKEGIIVCGSDILKIGLLLNPPYTGRDPDIMINFSHLELIVAADKYQLRKSARERPGVVDIFEGARRFRSLGSPTREDEIKKDDY